MTEDQALNEWIAEHVMEDCVHNWARIEGSFKCQKCPRISSYNYAKPPPSCPLYTEDLNLAAGVLEKVGWSWECGDNSIHAKYYCLLYKGHVDHNDYREVYGYGETEALAKCRAVKAAEEGKENGC